MIVAPFNSPVFYAGAFTKTGASFLASKFSDKYASFINSAYVISNTVKNDIQPTVELIQAVSEIYDAVDVRSTQVLDYNPSYLPSAKEELSKNLEYDDEGNISTISGFSNPYVTLSVKQKRNGEILFDGVVSYKPFELPTLTEIINPRHGIDFS